MRAHGNVCLLAAEGYLNQIVLGGDVCQKTHLATYGGKGLCQGHPPLCASASFKRIVGEKPFNQITVEIRLHARPSGRFQASGLPKV